MEGPATLPTHKANRLRFLLPWVTEFLLGTALCGAVCWGLFYRPMMGLMGKAMALNPAGDARQSLIQLERLRAGDTQRAIGALQMRLDVDIEQLGIQTGALKGVKPQPLDATSSAYIKETLQRAVAYFVKYPRTPQEDPAYADSEKIIGRTLAAARAGKASGSAP